ncbi:MAG TPA: tetratricopeptide repeat protein, partial [Pyrinomonadaceae bacterium]|nr:tetratricopeptide repeat protein [Pyrinomonadaceae bacterium]
APSAKLPPTPSRRPLASEVNAQKLIILAAGLVAGFAAGFFLANNVNSKEASALRAEVARLRASSPDASATGAGQQTPAAQTPTGEDEIPNLTDEQLRTAVAKADASPADAQLQRISGQGLYFYAMQKGNATILPDAARILRRAHEADPKDAKITVLLANALFVLSQNGEPERLADARVYYQKALAVTPADAAVRTSLGRTYFYAKPSDARSAIREYRKALEIEPRNELALHDLAAALIATGELDEAERRLAELERVNPEAGALANLRAQLAQKRNEAREAERP